MYKPDLEKAEESEIKLAGQESTARTGHGTMDWFQIGEGVHQGCILSLCLFLTYLQSTSCKMPGWMTHKLVSRLPRGKKKKKIAKGNISNHAYVDDTTLMAESKEPLDESEREE